MSERHATERYARRDVLVLGASGVAALAGCSEGSSDGTPTGAGETPGEDTPTGTPTESSSDGSSTGTPTESPADDTPTGTSTESGTYMNGVGSSASVSFAVPTDGAELTSSSVQWDGTADVVTIEKAGEVTEGAGHYHIMVDTEPVPPGEIIPSDARHVHYGTGQTEGVLELSPGDHTLHLQVGDGEHRAMGLTDTVGVTVSEEASLSLETSVEGSVVEWSVTADNYSIEPADAGIQSTTGHLHAIIDTGPVPVGDVIPSDARHVHFGDGSTSGRLDLADQLGEAYEPGEHMVHFQVGSATHRATTVLATATVTTD